MHFGARGVWSRSVYVPYMAASCTRTQAVAAVPLMNSVEIHEDEFRSVLVQALLMAPGTLATFRCFVALHYLARNTESHNSVITNSQVCCQNAQWCSFAHTLAFCSVTLQPF